MKNVIILTFIFVISACATTKIVKKTELKIPILVRNVFARVDFTIQEDVATQIKDIVTIMTYNPMEEQKFFLDITVSQRSFLHDVTNKNSIYTSCELLDSGGKVLHRFSFIDMGAGTILNAEKQNKIAKKIVKILDETEIIEATEQDLPQLTLSN
ncbi:MAG: hypothetical protein IIW10_06270 [Spirochaetaceae bacterium]|nr:hypothetical protein [Spirochaetaceae bacterium]